MSGIIKLVIVGALLFGGYAAWKYIFSPSVKMAEENSLYTVASDDHVKGQADAPVTLIEYTDFQCPACGAYYPVLKQLLSEMDGKFKLVIRHYPLIQIHPNALSGARAAEAAGRQGKFFEMYDELFTKQNEWSKAADPTKSIYPSYAQSIGLNVDQFKKDMTDSSLDDKINKDRETGNSLDVQGTPSFFMNGEKITNPNNIEEFKVLIEAAVLKAPVVKKDETHTEEVHEHIDLRVYIDNKTVDFSQEKYQSDLNGKALDDSVHMHDKNGSIVHKHKKGVTLSHFFKTLGMAFTKDCFQLDGGAKLCNGNGKTLKFFVNGKLSTQFAEYELHDLDRVLVSYGKEDEKTLQSQIDSVGNEACIYSETCPERGKPPTENCVGGLGSDCK